MAKKGLSKKPKVAEGVVIRPNSRKYEPWMCQKVIEVAAQGGHVAAMLKELDIARDTFYRWIKEYEEFGLAYQKAKDLSQAFYEEIGLAGTLGKIKNFNFNAYAMTMNNKFPEDYKRSANAAHTEVNIGSINTIEGIMQMDSAELTRKIEELSQKYLTIESAEQKSHDD